MGWTCTYKPPGQSLVEFFIERGVLSWSSDLPRQYRILDSALVNLTEFYAALEVTDKATGERYVTALVFLIKMFREDRKGFNCCWKDMDENMWPGATNCPERILKLLTPTDNEGAKEWREACWDKIEKRKLVPPLRKGVVLNFDTPIRFSSGEQSKLVVDSVKGQKIVCTDEDRYNWYRLKRSWINAMAGSGELHFA